MYLISTCEYGGGGTFVRWLLRPKEALDPLELELEATVIGSWEQTWVLRKSSRHFFITKPSLQPIGLGS